VKCGNGVVVVVVVVVQFDCEHLDPYIDITARELEGHIESGMILRCTIPMLLTGPA